MPDENRSELNSNHNESKASIEVVSAAFRALDQEYTVQAEPGTEEHKQKDERIKHRLSNLLDAFKSRYNLPDVINLTDAFEGDASIVLTDMPSNLKSALLPEHLIAFDGRKEKGRKFLYYKTKDKKFVTGYYVPSFMKIIKPKIDFEKEVNTDGHWGFFANIVENALIERMPPLDEISLYSHWLEKRSKER